MCSCYGIAFGERGSWSFGNGFTKNIVIFGVENSLSSHIDNCKSNFLVLGEGPIDDISDSAGEKS